MHDRVRVPEVNDDGRHVFVRSVADIDSLVKKKWWFVPG
jgi:hypothetical protein